MLTVPPLGIASRALTTRFMITCSICPGSTRVLPSLAAGTIRSSTSSPDDAAEHLVHSGDDLVQVHDGRREHLLPAEREELPGQLGGALAGPPDLLDVRAHLAVRRQVRDQHGAVAQNDGEQVVEVVRDASRQPARRLHLLRLPKLLLALAEG